MLTLYIRSARSGCLRGGDLVGDLGLAANATSARIWNVNRNRKYASLPELWRRSQGLRGTRGGAVPEAGDLRPTQARATTRNGRVLEIDSKAGSRLRR
eukprot:12724475-Alexandrium_andersonii.AAC.1